jgi:hypothetical protein
MLRGLHGNTRDPIYIERERDRAVVLYCLIAPINNIKLGSTFQWGWSEA